MTHHESSGGGLSLSGLGIGLLIGAAVGAGIGLLLAPHTGRETRESLKKRYHEIAGKIHRVRAGSDGVEETVPAGEEG
jgi:gas vesicle protein